MGESPRFRGLAAAAALLAGGGLLAAIVTDVPASRAATASTPVAAWGVAQRIPRLDALVSGPGSAVQLNTVTCPAPGDCTAGGYISYAADSFGNSIVKARLATEGDSLHQRHGRRVREAAQGSASRRRARRPTSRGELSAPGCGSRDLATCPSETRRARRPAPRNAD